ncbi:MAG: MarR family transcriptional regulator [Actinobacteria bacterium]|nr:MarR family transcriptional regulator [Actinomycetota bacterium]MBV8481170.1 MarR family transcriptional regulator [Actinomycetota bacterium]
MADDDVVIPALLRAARGAYGVAIGKRLAAASFDDLPRNGPFILGGMGNHGVAAGDLVRQLGVSKQAAGQLIDTLVLRGYLERQTNPDDRRRVTIALTDRGRAAATEVRAGVEEVDRELAARLTAEQLDGLRMGLVALTTIREQLEEAGR